MQSFQFEYKDSLVSSQEFESFGKELSAEIKRLNLAREHGYDTPYAALNVPFDEQQLVPIQTLAAQKKQLNPQLLVLIGIGGSNLGTLAVYEGLKGRFQPIPRLLCADTVDPDQLAAQLVYVEQLLQNKQEILINVVTKSGKTTETIANFELFLALLKQYRPETFHEYVVVTTDEGSEFAQFAQGQKYAVLTIPPKVGGRYSVLTAVGLFPLLMLGIDVEALCNGARSITSSCLDSNVMQNPAALSAIAKFAYYQQCVNIHDLFVFATNLYSMGMWYRQLMGESVGKELNRSNQRVEVGITPTVSVGSTDLHSVGQLYLGGPRDKFTTFLAVHQRNSVITLPQMPEFEAFVPSVQKMSVAAIMNAILGGVEQAYRSHQRPFLTITLPEISAASLGQLLQFYMIEMMYLGFLLDVNPFDQPNVELYKQETRKILSNG